MKLRNAFLITVVAASATIAAFCPKPIPASERDAVVLKKMTEIINQLHFQPQVVNDEFSQKVYKLYLDRLDAGRRFLTKTDIDKLAVYADKLDDEIKVQDFTFFDLSYSLINDGVVKAETYCTNAFTKTFDFSTNDKFDLDGDKKPYAANDMALQDTWYKTIKHDVLTRLVSKLEDKEKGKEDVKTKTEEELKAQAIKESNKAYTDYFKRLKKVKRSSRLSTYFNSMINVYDPHSEYFEPVEKQAFDLRMSGRLIGIGARLQTDIETEFTKVSDIVIGGPAWKQGTLKEGDLVMKVAQGDKLPVDVSGMDLNDVVSMIRGELGKEVRLTVKSKADGKVKVIPIIREEIIIDEGFARSLILQANANSDKIGYLKLPAFYADFEKEDGHQSAEDVEAELTKLKQSGVKGIILDLRNNGGGSLRDVVKMAGFFIEEGPIVQVKNRYEKPDIMSDNDNTVQYNGPFIIMQNEFSASASEIMSAALQDYGRAIIVGTNSYGKGSVQRFVELDRMVSGNDNLKPLGSLKVTIQKFFRVNGGSTQLKGVAPDITIPDDYMFIPVGEKDNEHPMAWTQISPVKYSQSVGDLSKVLPKIIANSKQRIDANPTFKAITENAQRIKAQRDLSEVSLNLTDYRTFESKQKDISDKYEKVREGYFLVTEISAPSTTTKLDKNKSKTDAPTSGKNSAAVLLVVANNILEDMNKLTATNDSTKLIRNKAWLKDVKKDIQLSETMNIMHDLIQSGSFKTAQIETNKH